MRNSQFSLNNIELLTLSACETFKGNELTLADSANIESLGALLYKRGAQSVLASLWNVADESTAPFMRRFYEIIKTQKRTKAEALQQVQVEFQNGKAGEYQHPYFWAPFILMGNWL